MKIFTASALSAALCLTTVPLIAAEGLLITQKMTVNGKARTSQVQIEKERMRAEVDAATGERQVIVFDGPKQVLTMIYPDKKAYAELTKADVDQMSQMGGASRMTISPAMQEQMDKMPPGQRALMEQMMAKKVPSWMENFKNAMEVGDVKIYACSMTMELFDMKLADLEPIVTDITGVATFVERAREGRFTLFI